MAFNDYLATHYSVPLNATKEFTLYLALKRLTVTDSGKLFAPTNDSGVFSLQWSSGKLSAFVQEGIPRTSVEVDYTDPNWSILSVVCNKANPPSSKFRIRLNGQDLAQTLGDSDNVTADFAPSELQLSIAEGTHTIELRAWLMFEVAHNTQQLGDWETRLRRRYL